MDLEEQKKQGKILLETMEANQVRLDGIVDSIMILVKGLNHFDIKYVLDKMDFKFKYDSRIQ